MLVHTAYKICDVFCVHTERTQKTSQIFTLDMSCPNVHSDVVVVPCPTRDTTTTLQLLGGSLAMRPTTLQLDAADSRLLTHRINGVLM